MLGRLLEKAAGGAEAGVREDRVDPSEGVKRGLRQRLILIPLSDVGGDRDRLLVAAELGGQVAELVLAARGEDQAIPVLGGLARGRASVRPIV